MPQERCSGFQRFPLANGETLTCLQRLVNFARYFPQTSCVSATLHKLEGQWKCPNTWISSQKGKSRRENDPGSQIPNVPPHSHSCPGRLTSQWHASTGVLHRDAPRARRYGPPFHAPVWLVAHLLSGSSGKNRGKGKRSCQANKQKPRHHFFPDRVKGPRRGVGTEDRGGDDLPAIRQLPRRTPRPRALVRMERLWRLGWGW
ncbi:hypothetical protein QBC32DRAFT_388373 [Pseudoneurospora amorphoporcata]|uniref:Uncharacterized protein n=1 Tax=Pseudoneurospora amorphoporcata TaxID=241081 RepID=A0AAN6SJZ7_9PEZI|nr:hypothetical protein QBC32DRAFT_388373 [Pseudoneurospora amorphoporcata]